MKRWIAVLLLLTTLALQGQTTTEGYYRLPMDIPVLLSGSFAEMRSGHFHSGIDFKTGGQEGVPLKCAADGTVARIVVNPAGYGRALYIDHPNGTTTVYAHMQRFTPGIENYLLSERYRLQSDKVDLAPPAGKFTFKKGELIGYSGNSGMSGGPHLHFEIRQTSSQAVIDPVSSGNVAVRDDIPPVIYKLFYIQVDTIQGVPVNSAPKEIAVRKIAAGSYTTAAAEISVARNGYFVIEAIDYKNDTRNRMGILSARQSIDGKVNIEQRRDKFLFSDTRYVNALAHYALNRTTSNEMIRLAVLAGNKLPVYTHLQNRGAVVLNDSLPHMVSIELADDCNNISCLDFKVRRGAQPALHIPQNSLVARHDKAFHYENDTAGITIPAGALYEPAVYTQQQVPFATVKSLSPVYAFMDIDTPLHAAATFWIATDIPPAFRSKATLAKVSGTGSLSYAGGSCASATPTLPERVTAQLRELGRYCVIVDTIPPKIAAGFASGADMSSRKSLSFTISDDFSGIKSYSGTINGKWALIEYDIQKKTLTHFLDATRFGLGKGTHSIMLEVTDNMGNKSVYKGNFIIK